MSNSDDSLVRICTANGISRVVVDLRKLNSASMNRVYDPIYIVIRDRNEIQWRRFNESMSLAVDNPWNRLTLDPPVDETINRQSG